MRSQEKRSKLFPISVLSVHYCIHIHQRSIKIMLCSSNAYLCSHINIQQTFSSTCVWLRFRISRLIWFRGLTGSGSCWCAVCPPSHIVMCHQKREINKHHLLCDFLPLCRVQVKLLKIRKYLPFSHNISNPQQIKNITLLSKAFSYTVQIHI